MNKIELLEMLIDEIETKETIAEALEILNEHLDDIREESGRQEIIDEMFEDCQDI